MSGKVAAFASFGVTLKNDRWSWSGRTSDGKTVAIQLWLDGIKSSPDAVTYSDYDDPNLDLWMNLPGNRERIENIKWAIAHCNGEFRVVIGVAKDVNARPRATLRAYPKPQMIMKIKTFDEETGEFSAELVRRPDATSS